MRKKCLHKVASFLKHNPDENDLYNPSFFSAANIPYKPVDLTGLNLQCQPAVITKMNKLLLFTIIIIMKTTGCNQNLFVCLRCGRQQRGILWRCIFKYVIQKASKTFGSGGLKKTNKIWWYVCVHVYSMEKRKFTLSFSILQPYDVNLQVTSVIALLSQFNHPQLQEYLLNATLSLAHDCRTLHLTLQNVSICRLIN